MEFAKVRDEIAKREANLQRLEALGQEVDQAHGARFRVWGAVVAIILWTFHRAVGLRLRCSNGGSSVWTLGRARTSLLRRRISRVHNVA